MPENCNFCWIYYRSSVGLIGVIPNLHRQTLKPDRHWTKQMITISWAWVAPKRIGLESVGNPFCSVILKYECIIITGWQQNHFKNCFLVTVKIVRSKKPSWAGVRYSCRLFAPRISQTSTRLPDGSESTQYTLKDVSKRGEQFQIYFHQMFSVVINCIDHEVPSSR